MYVLEEITTGPTDKKVRIGLRITTNKSCVATIVGGLTETIWQAFLELDTYSEQQQAFLKGIALAMAHCVVTGAIPTIVDKAP